MRHLSRSKHVFVFTLCIPCVLVMTYMAPYSLRFLEGLIPMDTCPLPYGSKLGDGLDHSLDLWSRNDVQTCTSWGAPIIWEGMFDPDEYDREHRRRGTSVALSVFAVGRYLDTYLKDFLTSAEQHFMVGLPVTYYVFTDIPERVPTLQLAKGRRLSVHTVLKHSRWQDISMMRMQTISDTILSHIRHHHQYVFCFDVDQVFVGRFGSEALGDLVAQMHAFYYHRPRIMYTYERDARSAASIQSRGDFYYHAAIFGGHWQKVWNLTKACHGAIVQDKENKVEALWHDESHLNKYLWLHKPTKVLSPEYCWAEFIGYRSDIRVSRMLWADKHYNTLRK